MRTARLIFALHLAAWLLPPWSAAPAEEVRLAPEALAGHCFRCHGAGKVEGEVNLVAAFAAEPRGLASDLELLEAMIEALSEGHMPPQDERQPAPAERDRWVAQLTRLLDDQLARQSVLPTTPIRRLNRSQYNNAVKDLFQLNRDPFPLPERTVRDISGYFQPATGKMPQRVTVGNRAMGKSQFLGAGNTLSGVSAYPKDNRAEHGFDNRGDHLTLSPALMESFFSLGQSIVNSPEFARSCGVWDSLFAAPPGMSAEQQRGVGEQRLRAFLRQAFRRDVSDETVARYQGYFLRQLDGGATFTESMKGAIAAALVSPRFLYLYSSPVAEHSDGREGEFDLASRLSFCLWNSTPDDTLLDLAAAGKLSDPQVLREQIDRMMNDPRLKSFCDSFALQWLQLDLMVSAVPDNRRFRPYYFGGATGMVYMVGMHMMVEPLLLFETVLVEDRPITELIDPPFTYRSDMLRAWYDRGENGRTEVIGIQFQREPIKDRRWGGVITNAAVLTMTSSPLRTKPITRGAWLATAIFNDPPEPPPADVPELADDETQLKQEGLTLRQKLKQHIANPRCATCHQQIDPLGFALENYDPVGRWRETYRSGLPVDSSGKLFNRHDFSHPVGFKDAILAEKERFARALAGHLLSYALGRKLAPADRPALDAIVANSAKENYRFRTMVREVLLSKSFTNHGSVGPEKQ